jgi:crotonobetainyl-CoA:carnitine CoA-transferase CaiB-like acyl-CoA transferase
VAVAVEDDAQWEALRALLGRPAWAEDPELRHAAGRVRRRAELDARLEAWTRGLDKREVFERCRAAGVPAAPVWQDLELVVDPQLRARAFHETLSHPVVGEWLTSGWVWRPQGAGPCVRRAGPRFAEHNDEILGGLLGLSAEEIAQLEADGVTSRVPLNLPPMTVSK